MTCSECGHRNEAGADFCGQCGAFLGWDSADQNPAAERTQAPSVPSGQSGGQGGGHGARADAAMITGTGTDTSAAAVTDTAAPHSAVTDTTAAAATTATADTNAAAANPADTNTAAAQSAAALPHAIEPEAGDAAPRDGEAEPDRAGTRLRKPGEKVEPRRRPAPAPVTEAPPAPGDLICPSCGAGNAPDRRFCRRCGRPLVAAAVVARPPWWRRALTRPSRPRKAGERNRPPTRYAWWLRRLALVLAALLGLAYVLPRTPLRGVIDTVREASAKPVLVSASSIHASSELRNHPARLAIDHATNRYWATGRAGSGRGEFLDASFKEPFKLREVVVFSGASPRADQFDASPRPSRFELVAVSADGAVLTRKQLTLEDKPGQQTFEVRANGVQRIRLTILASYGAETGGHVSVGEVEFYTRGRKS